jgi:hypothetical protein
MNCRGSEVFELMKSAKALAARRASFLILAAGVHFAAGFSSRAQNVQHLSITQPGGMPGLPVMTGIERVTNGVNVMWYGPPGYYQLQQKLGLKDPKWLSVGGLNPTNKATITTINSNAFFRVSGPSPQYAGSQTCAECHQGIHDAEMNTPHAGAFTNALFAAEGGQTNRSCLPCHTVGYGLPTGFVSQSKTPQLAGVQCENCHGPAANHAANPDDPVARPRIELAATVCGGCHTTSQHPTYDEWKTSDHAELDPQVAQLMSRSTNYIDSCGRCHSGSARLSLVKNALLPVGDADVNIGCATCHDPHANHVWTNVLSGVIYTNQLRYPLSSTNSYPLSPTNNYPLFSTSNYVPTNSAPFTNASGINICAQCHNVPAASWTNSIAAPHPSTQYNFLLGAIGELATGTATNNPASHAGLPSTAQYSVSGTFYLTNQCVSCHMQSDAAPATTHSHGFTVGTYDVCLQCHPFRPDLLLQFVEIPAISNRVHDLKYALDLWAATKAPAALQTNGSVAWEYTNPGGLVWQTNQAGIVTGWVLADQVSFKGPDANGQTLIPDTIKKARFNLYVVLGDGSFGVHNPFFALNLLDTAQGWVTQELNQ